MVRRPACPGESNGQVSVFASGGTAPYQYLWNGSQVPSLLNPITSLPAGTVTVRIIDANQCLSDVFQTEIIDPPTIVATFSNVQNTSCPDDTTCDGQATVVATYSDGTTGDFVFYGLQVK
ncbi:MAG: SprB repeat-containing protein [Saprospiraceae bacterium]